MDSTRQVIGISGLICFGTEIKPLVLILLSNLPLSQDACSCFRSACHDSHCKEKNVCPDTDPTGPVDSSKHLEPISLSWGNLMRLLAPA